jgi:hypothetical protein
MRSTKALLSGLVVVVLVASPFSSASAAWRHRGIIPDVFGAAAAIVVGAATIATAPLAIIAGAGPRGYYGGPPGYAYDRPPRDYYGGPAAGYGYEGPPRGYYAPPQARYYAPPRDYGSRSDYYRPRPRYYGPPPGY